MMHLGEVGAEELLRPYRGVVPYHADAVRHLKSGPCVALKIQVHLYATAAAAPLLLHWSCCVRFLHIAAPSTLWEIKSVAKLALTTAIRQYVML